MPTISKTLLLLGVAGVVCYAGIPIVIDAFDPNFGTPADGIFGDPLKYAIQGFTLVGPSAGGVVGQWTLTIDTNYGITLPGSADAPPSTAVIPGFCEGGNPPFPTCAGGGVPLFMSDFIIQQGSNDFGVVLSQHIEYTPGYTDKYVPGYVYEASGVQNSQHFNNTPGHPVILATVPGIPTPLNTGTPTLTAAAIPGCFGGPHGSGAGATNCAEFQVTDTFTISSASSFFDPNGAYTIYASSADCDNGPIVLQHSPVPEPGGLVWLVPGLLLLGAYLRRRSLAHVK